MKSLYTLGICMFLTIATANAAGIIVDNQTGEPLRILFSEGPEAPFACLELLNPGPHEYDTQARTFYLYSNAESPSLLTMNVTNGKTLYRKGIAIFDGMTYTIDKMCDPTDCAFFMRKSKSEAAFPTRKSPSEPAIHKKPSEATMESKYER